MSNPIVDGRPLSGLEAGLLPHDLSPWGMFLAAHPVVQAVMIGLALASVATWSVWLAKTIELRQARIRARRVMAALGETTTLSDAARRLDGIAGIEAHLVRCAMEETKLSHGGQSDGLIERIRIKLVRLEAAAGRRMAVGTGILASVGSVAPFVGLFGTVWGVMNSFIGISQAHTTNLAVVAPGIAEALLATATGLIAAIPAVVIYNAFARAISGYRALVGDVAAEILRLVSRDLDRRSRPVRDAAE